MHHNCRACALEPRSRNRGARGLQLRTPKHPRACAPTRGATAMRSLRTATGGQALLATARERPGRQGRPSTAISKCN